MLMFIKYRIHVTILIGKSPWSIKILFSWNIPRILYHYRYNFRFPACPRLCNFLIYSSITLIFLLDLGFRLVSRACANFFNPMLLIIFLLVDNSHVLTFQYLRSLLPLADGIINYLHVNLISLKFRHYIKRLVNHPCYSSHNFMGNSNIGRGGESFIKTPVNYPDLG